MNACDGPPTPAVGPAMDPLLDWDFCEPVLRTRCHDIRMRPWAVRPRVPIRAHIGRKGGARHPTAHRPVFCLLRTFTC